MSKKYIRKIKKTILTALIIITTISYTLAIMKLVGISVHNFKETGKTTLTKIFADSESKTEEVKSNISYINGVKINGQEITFNQSKTNYTVNLPYDTEEYIKLEYLKANENQTINGQDAYIMDEFNKKISFIVTSEDKTSKTEYTLNLKKEHNAYLKNIEIKNFSIVPEFEPKTTEYGVTIYGDNLNLEISTLTFDKESKVTIEGQNGVSAGSVITIKVTNQYVSEPVIYTIKAAEASENNSYTYTGEYKEYIVPYTGVYKFEVWGAGGGTSRINGSVGNYAGKGGYASGDITLKKGEKYYVYVGQKGTDAVVKKDSVATWNGGGLGTWDHSDDEAAGAGGGATDIRLVSGNWDDSKSLASRIMVAGGGGGASWKFTAGNGGGIKGTTGTVAKEGTQTSGYKFGIGQDGYGTANSDGVGGRRPEVTGVEQQ